MPHSAESVSDKAAQLLPELPAQLILESWLNRLESDRPPVYATTTSAELLQVCHEGLEALQQALAPDSPQPSKIVEWALAQHHSYQASLTDILKLIFALRSAFIDQLDNTNGLTGQIFRAIDAALNSALFNITDAFNLISQEQMTERVSQLEQIVLQSSNVTKEAEQTLIQVHTLYDVSQRLGASLNLTEIMREIVTQLTRITYAHSSAIWLVGEDILQVKEAQPKIEQKLLLPLNSNNSYLLKTLQQKEPLFIQRTNLEAANTFDLGLFDTLKATVLLALPLIIQDNVIGLVTLHGTNKELATDLNLAKAIVQQGAIAIANGQLYQEVQDLNQTLEQRIAARTQELVEEKERLEAMYQLTALLTTTLDLEQMIGKTLHQLAQSANAQNGAILLNDYFTNDLFYEASLEGHKPKTRVQGVDKLLGDWIMARRQTILVNDFPNDSRWEVDFDNTRSVMAAPLMVGSDLHGVLILSDAAPNKFTPSHLRMIEAVAVQVAAAVNNAELHNYVSEQTIRLGQMLQEQRVQTSQNQAILSSISDGVIASDSMGEIILVNPTAEEILGGSGERLVGQPVQEIFAIFEPEGRQEILNHLAAFEKRVKNNEAQMLEMREIILEVDQRVISARLTAALTPSGEAIGVVTVLRDITKEVQADRAKSEFVSMVSHELRTPMTSIKGYTTLLSQGALGPLEEKQKQFLQVVLRNIDRLTGLINDLLDVSRIEAGKIRLDLEEVQLSNLAKEVVETLHLPAENKGLTLTLDTPPDLPSVKADWDRITQVLTNLVGNAIAYTEAGSVQVCLRQVADVIQISVQDTGIGIPPENLEHIFERFHRADNEVVQAHSGTGLGLPIAKSFIEMHGGRIWVDSQVGQGSTFSFILPAINANH